MSMRLQLRDYLVKPGEMDAWIAEWARHVRPLREAMGFKVLGAWAVRAEDRFVWILGHDDFDAADERYYASPERRSLDPDPARHLAETRHAFIDRIA
jgi:hypothetical protein